MNYISILSTIVTFILMAAVFRRYQLKGGAYLLVWSLGFLFYGLGTLSEVILSFTFSPLMLKVWYLTGAMLTAAWLGQGTVYLLVRRRGVASLLAVILGDCQPGRHRVGRRRAAHPGGRRLPYQPARLNPV